MFTIRKARIDDCGLINQMAGEVFPATYQGDLISRTTGLYDGLDVLSRKYPETNGRRRSCLFYRI